MLYSYGTDNNTVYIVNVNFVMSVSSQNTVYSILLYRETRTISFQLIMDRNNLGLFRRLHTINNNVSVYNNTFLTFSKVALNVIENVLKLHYFVQLHFVRTP